MKIEVINPHGLCSGVNAAIAKALKLRNVYCLHHLVHNEIVIDELKALGFRFVDDIEAVPDGETVVFSAHGVSPQIRKRAEEKKLKIVDTTCPFVERVHRDVRTFQEQGLKVIVLGDREHDEVKGILGELKDHRDPEKGEKVGVVSQTTMNADLVAEKIAALKKRYEVVAEGTVCRATKERQDAVRSFDGDALLVLGSRSSANTKRLAEIANCDTFLASDMNEVMRLAEKLSHYDRVGVTSGASTPERFFESAVRYLSNIPRHVAIIMDGNGRWAESRGLKRGEGHKAGAKTLMEVVRWCGDRGIRYVSVYAFSTENWKRPEDEVSGLMKLFGSMLSKEAATFVKNKVRLRVIGRRGDLSFPLRKAIAALEKKTEKFERELILCVSYGGRAEIVDAVNRAIEKGEKVTEETFREYLYAPDVPDPDLVIRTSGEVRTSNFLLWESAYAEYHFTATNWPDFSERDLDAALEDYAGRHRRKGDVK